jgi:hypothetical protein
LSATGNAAVLFKKVPQAIRMDLPIMGGLQGLSPATPDRPVLDG